jgi:DNA-binding NtrC family response regulator
MDFEKVLVVDDEPLVCRALQSHLNRKHYTVMVAHSVEEAKMALKKDRFDLVFVDLRLPDGDGTELLESGVKRPDAPFFVMMTGYATVESAVSCMRSGAFDYLMKPFSNGQIDIIIQKAEQFRHILNVAHFYSREDDSESELLGKSEAIREVKSLIERVAPTQATVLIHGESGTGKELIASEIHRSSPRADAPFIRVNCAAISENLIESEFFGHEKGAFTGANERRIGRFELANGGTILLDEISEISPGLQAKLLRVLQEKQFERVGGNKTIQVDVRVLATTNRNLQKEVEAGAFREDLFYRLNVFPIHNPPLRDRKDDILILAKIFTSRVARRHGVRITGISEAAMKMLMNHSWPGNVRELQNTIERAVILTGPGQDLSPQSLGMIAPIGSVAVKEVKISSESDHLLAIQTITPLADVEKKLILDALKICEGNRTHAAEALGISIRNMRNKIAQYRSEGEIIP